MDGALFIEQQPGFGIDIRLAIACAANIHEDGPVFALELIDETFGYYGQRQNILLSCRKKDAPPFEAVIPSAT